MTGTPKTIVVIFCILIAIGVTTAFYLWNKPHQDVANAAAVKTSAVELYKVFNTDSVTANKKFVQQVMHTTQQEIAVGFIFWKLELN